MRLRPSRHAGAVSGVRNPRHEETRGGCRVKRRLFNLALTSPRAMVFVRRMREPMSWRHRVDIVLLAHFVASYACACVRVLVAAFGGTQIHWYAARSIIAYSAALLASPALIPLEIGDRTLH